MKLKLEEILKREKIFLNVAGIMIGTRILDTVSTSLAMSEYNSYIERIKRTIVETHGPPVNPEAYWTTYNYGFGLEQNFITRDFMERFGINQGLVLQDLALGIPVLGVAYLFNKCGKNNFYGNKMLYVVSALSTLAAVQNMGIWWQYRQMLQ